MAITTAAAMTAVTPRATTDDRSGFEAAGSKGCGVNSLPQCLHFDASLRTTSLHSGHRRWVTGLITSWRWPSARTSTPISSGENSNARIVHPGPVRPLESAMIPTMIAPKIQNETMETMGMTAGPVSRRRQALPDERDATDCAANIPVGFLAHGALPLSSNGLVLRLSDYCNRRQFENSQRTAINVPFEHGTVYSSEYLFLENKVACGASLQR